MINLPDPIDWFAEGYNAYLSPLRAKTPPCLNLTAVAEFRRGYQAAADEAHFSSGYKT